MLLDELAQLIQDSGLATIGTNLFKSFMPDSPATAITVYETGGTLPQQTLGSTNCAWEMPRVQIVCRSTDYQIARNKAEDIFGTMNGVVNQILKPSTGAAGCRYIRIEAVQSPFSLGQDANARLQVVCNYQVMKEVST